MFYNEIERNANRGSAVEEMQRVLLRSWFYSRIPYVGGKTTMASTMLLIR